MSTLLSKSNLKNSGTGAQQFEPLLTVNEVAELTRLSTRTIRRLIVNKELLVVRIGRAVRVRPGDLGRLLNGQEMTGDDRN
jgi:excisionase family DNA binding protein